MSSNIAPNLSTWTPESGREPLVRIGVVLEEDAQSELHLQMPGRTCILGGATALSQLPPATPLAVCQAGNYLLITLPNTGEPIETRSIRIADETIVEVAADQGILVRDVVAGRGFHWQKKLDQTLSGAVEIHAGQRGLVLVNELPLENYLAGVITSEMSGDCPLALLQAQCVVARSWLLALAEPKHTDQPFNRCNDDCCQRYQGTGGLTPAAIEAVCTTRGRVLIAPAGNVLDANYAKSCGGISELAEHVWGAPKSGISAIVDAPQNAAERAFYPVNEANLEEYLTGAWTRAAQAYCSPNAVPVDSIARYLGRVDEVDDYFRWSVSYTRAELEELLRQKLPEARDLTVLVDLRITARGVSGRASHLEIDWQNRAGQRNTMQLTSEYDIRAALHRGFLYSSAIVFHVKHTCANDGRINHHSRCRLGPWRRSLPNRRPRHGSRRPRLRVHLQALLSRNTTTDRLRVR